MGGVVSSGSATQKDDEVVDPNRKATASDVKEAIMISRSGSFKNQKKAATTFYQFAQTGDDVHDHIIEGGGLLPLIQLFHSKSPEVQETSMLALSEFCKSDKCRSFVLSHGGCSVMTEGIKSKHSNVRDATLDVIRCFDDDHDILFKIADDAAIHGMLRYLREDANPRDVSAMEVLLKLSKQEKYREKMVQDLGIEQFFSAIFSSVKSSETKALCLQIFSELCCSQEGPTRVYSLNGNTGLQRIISLVSSHSEEMAMHATIALARLGQSRTLSKYMVAEGLLQNMKRPFKSKNTAVLLAAVTLLTILAQSLEHVMAIGKGGFIMKIMRLCQSTAEDLQLANIRLLGLLTLSEANVQIIISFGGYRMLTQLAKSENAFDVCIAAQDALSKLAHVVDAKREAAVQTAVHRFKTMSKGRDSPKAEFARPA